MLAQNFKTPADLKIEDRWFEALVKLLGMLERGELRHTPTSQIKPLCDERVRPEVGLFNMNRWSVKFQCGTVCCLGGTAEAIGGFRFSAMPEALTHLFHPGHDGWSILHRIGGYETITTEQAAIALRNYLTFGEPRWAEALAE
jgi:hypothetical protein